MIVLIQDDNQNLLYISAEGLADRYTIDNVLEGYIKYHNIKHIDNLVISGQAKSKIRLEYLQNIISNVAFDSRVKSCSYDENFSLGDSEIRFFGSKDNCNMSVTSYNDEVLILSKMKNSQQLKFKSLYSRMLKPKTIVSSSELSKSLLKTMKPNYYVFSGDNTIGNKYFKILKNQGIKIFDTYNNGAVSLRYTNSGVMNVESELKKY